MFTITISVFTFVYIFPTLIVIFRGASIGSTDILDYFVWRTTFIVIHLKLTMSTFYLVTFNQTWIPSAPLFLGGGGGGQTGPCKILVSPCYIYSFPLVVSVHNLWRILYILTYFDMLFYLFSVFFYISVLINQKFICHYTYVAFEHVIGCKICDLMNCDLFRNPDIWCVSLIISHAFDISFVYISDSI